MAKIKFGMMMTDARGKLGGQVFSKNRGGAYVRTKVTPSNPRSVAQMFSRANLSAVSSMWNTLTDAQRKSWNSSVEEYKRTDIFGDLKTPSGKNLFTRLNKNLLDILAPTTLVPQPKIEIPAIKSTAVNVIILDKTVSFVPALPTDEGVVYQIWATPQLSQGISYVKNRLRVIETVTPDDFVPATLYTKYVAKFGAPQAGDNIYFQVRLIGLNGQAGVPVSIKGIVSAE